jgi:hypothetical protein
VPDDDIGKPHELRVANIKIPLLGFILPPQPHTTAATTTLATRRHRSEESAFLEIAGPSRPAYAPHRLLKRPAESRTALGMASDSATGFIKLRAHVYTRSISMRVHCLIRGSG